MVAKLEKWGAAAALMTSAMLATAPAQAVDDKAKSGRRVFETVCIACHATGKDGAPRMGNQADWLPRAAKGMDKMTQNAVVGVRKMPAHGGQASLTDLEISRAVSFMVSNGVSPDPMRAYLVPQKKRGDEIVRDTCASCHGDGKNGAPKIGDMAAWTPRLEHGLGRLVQSAIRGHKNMPARGGMASLGDAETKAAVYAMVTQVIAEGTK